MIKISLKNTALLEKAQILIDNNIVGTATQKKPAIIELEERKTYLTIKKC